MIGALVLVAQLAIVAHAPNTASACEALEMSVAVSTAGHALPELTVPSLAPFDVLRSSSVPHVTYDAHLGATVAEYRYVLTTDRVGAFTIPAFVARSGTAVVRSAPLEIVMRPASTAPALPTVIARARIDTSLEVNTRVAASPETVFVGQQANYEVAVFLNQPVRDRLRRNPTFFPPDMQSMLAYDLPTHGEAPRRSTDSHCFDALVYQRALFPLMPGRFSIPPADLVYSLPVSASFFSREESHELQTDSTVLIAVAPPAAGRPADYGGAVGNLRVAARLDTNASRVGDPMMLTVRVSGTGNVKLFPRPRVGVPWASLVNGDERVAVDTMARRISGSKEFDWVLTPTVAGELDLPPIHYSYFNPDSRRYEVATTDPSHVHITPGTLASADTAKSQSLLALRARYRGPLGVPLHEHPAFWAVLALVPLPAISFGARDRRRRLGAKPQSAAARLAALARVGAAATDAREIRRTFVAALAERLNLGAEAFTRPGALARTLRRRGVSADTALSAEHFLRALDEAAFALDGALSATAARDAGALFDRIDAEALSRLRIPARTLGVLFAVGAGVAAAHAMQINDARRAFDRGVVSYEHHNFAGAREAFIDAATIEPRAPDAWANLGTAAWATADTARSVGAWQRALRLEPLASDVRDRAELVHALPLTATGYVLPVPPAWLFDLAAVVWCAAWMLLAIRLAARQPVAVRRFGVAAAAAVALVIAGLTLGEHTSGHGAAVLRQTLSLRENPELGSQRGTTGIIGEVVRTAGRSGAWTRVILDDGRDGWVETRQLLSLDPRDVSEFAFGDSAAAGSD